MNTARKPSSMIQAAIIMILLFNAPVHFAQWVNQPAPSGFNIFSCSFPSAQTGYVCGYGNLILKTTNGGNNWSDISFPGTADNLETVWFLNDNTGFIGSTNDTLMFTTNGGASWSRHFYAGSDVHRIFFINSTTGWLSSTNLYKTTNAGVNWSLAAGGNTEDFYFINETTGWKTTYSGGSSTLLKTTNGGSSWNAIHTTSNFRALYSVKFINENTGWVSGYREYIAATTNGGVNWVQQRDMDNSVGLYNIEFLNSSTGWAVGDNGTILSTTNGGSFWQVTIVPGGRLQEVEFVNQQTGWIVGGFGKIFKTTSGGFVHVENISVTASDFSLSQNYPNPFNPSTKFRFTIPASAGSGLTVRTEVFDITGKQIGILFNSAVEAGAYEGSFDGTGYSSGIYFYKLSVYSGGNKLLYSEVKKMSLIK